MSSPLPRHCPPPLRHCSPPSPRRDDRRACSASSGAPSDLLRGGAARRGHTDSPRQAAEINTQAKSGGCPSRRSWRLRMRRTQGGSSGPRRSPQAARGGSDPTIPPAARSTNSRPLCFLSDRVDNSAATPKQIAVAGNYRAARLNRDIIRTCTRRNARCGSGANGRI